MQATTPELEKAPLNTTRLEKNETQQDQAHLTLSQVAGQKQQQNGQGLHTAISLQVLNNPVPQPQPASTHYSYIVKIINPHRKRDIIVRHLHDMNFKLESVDGLRVLLMDQFQEHVPTTATFDVGYFEGKQQSNMWLATSDDLRKIYILMVVKCSYGVMV